MLSVKVIKSEDELDLVNLKKGEVHRLHMHLTDNSLGVPWRVPVVVIKGVEEGPVLGITAAVHGNELNGISNIFKLIHELDPLKLKGTLVLIPIANVPGYLKNQREFSDGSDLNRIMPGKVKGPSGEMYAYQFTNKIVSQFNYLLDLHTASHGRVNSLYIRADIESEETRTLAYLQNPQIIVKKYDEEGTLRAWANEHGVHAITIEIGNANAFQQKLIYETHEGIMNTLRHLEMIEGEVEDMIADATVCDKSYWIYSSKGGIVEVFPKLADKVKRDEVIAKVYDVFGQVKEVVKADKSGIVIGKNVDPNCEAGSRILHLGVSIIEPETEDIPGHDDYEES